jgi:hypothetical protein
MTYPNFLRPAPRVSALCLFAVCTAAAHADLKLVSSVSVTGKRGTQTVSAVSYFKGSMVRIDNGPITRITDSKTHKTILINFPKKAYVIPDDAATMKAAAGSIKQQGLKLSAHIKPTGKSKKIAGRIAHQYVGDLTASGKFPSQPGSVANVTFSIDEWTTDVSGVKASQADMMGTISDIIHTLAGVNGMEQVTRELSKIKGVPLVSKLVGKFTLTTIGGGAPKVRNISYDIEATTATEESLPMSIFQVPKGFVHEDMKGQPIKPAAKKK